MSRSTRRRNTNTDNTNLYPDLLDAANASLNNVLIPPPAPRPRGRPRKNPVVAAPAPSAPSAPPPMMMEEDEIRRPDHVRREQLIHHHGSTNTTTLDPEDRMLEEAMALSRAEFAAERQREVVMQREREERAALRHALAIPVSRLGMWQRSSSTPPQERLFLTHILDTLHYRTRTEEEEHLLSPPPLAEQHQQDFDSFILSLHKSKLYQPIAALFSS